MCEEASNYDYYYPTCRLCGYVAYADYSEHDYYYSWWLRLGAFALLYVIFSADSFSLVFLLALMPPALAASWLRRGRSRGGDRRWRWRGGGAGFLGGP